MSRKPIQVPEELKAKVEELKGSFRAKTEYEVIEKLIAYYEKKENHVFLEDSIRDDFKALRNKLMLRDDSQVVELLTHHYEESGALSKETFSLYLSMKRW